MITYINTTDLQDALREAKTLEAVLREEINKLYDRLAKVPDETKEWVGEKAKYYFNTVQQDKKQLESFCDMLTKQNNFLEKIINEAEGIING